MAIKIGSGNIDGTDSSDIIIGLGGDNEIDAGAGNDIVIAGSGDDTVFGGAGNDLLFGGSGKDKLYGGDGHDVFFCGDHDDGIFAGTGNNWIDGGSGDGDCSHYETQNLTLDDLTIVQHGANHYTISYEASDGKTYTDTLFNVELIKVADNGGTVCALEDIVGGDVA